MLFSALVVIMGGCKPHQEPSPSALRKVVFQTDWFPQAEHGGFYQALAKGYYEEVGLDVEIVSGGPGAAIKLKVAKGNADFGMLRSDDTALAVSRGLPLVLIAATMQHDAEALLVHAHSPVKDFGDLDGRTIMAPLSMAWIPFIQKKYGINFSLIPTTYGLATFLGDKNFIQSCFLTSEPYYARQQGVAVRTLPLTAAGYDVYQGIVCRRNLIRTEPEVVRAFLAATIRGWRDYLTHDPAPADAMILERNGNMSQGQLDYSRKALIDYALVAGYPAKGEDIGQLDLKRLQGEIDVLREFNILEQPLRAEDFATTDFLPVR
ncbi:MAG: ABC transporter substrate-binding protein [Cephaloticoccus sp.]|nr:ABC transporter substrate-binding protein [Cephaloticoccus sp.]MCF7760623.1 ABC transporter substrate-binding protein [Cephaloticoccus sp.]